MDRAEVTTAAAAIGDHLEQAGHRPPRVVLLVLLGDLSDMGDVQRASSATMTTATAGVQ